jgi:hypothetical protein
VSEINVLPRGVSSLLQFKSQNDVPKSFFDELIGTIDLTQFYLEGLTPNFAENVLAGRDLSTQSGVNIDPWTLPLVPDNEIWLVEQFSCQVSNFNVANTQACVSTAYVGYPTGGGSNNLIPIATDRDTATPVLMGSLGFANWGFMHAGCIAKPFLIGPGGSMGFFNTQVRAQPAATYTATLKAKFHRLRV